MGIFTEITQKQTSGEPFALATIVKTVGSSPRDVGAKMLINVDGSISGTIGGGQFERLVIDDCLSLFAGKISHLLKTYRFSENSPNTTGMYCGGEAEVFIELFGKINRLIIFGGGHIGKELVKIASGLNFKIIVVDNRKDILDSYNTPVETVLTDLDYNDNFPSLDEDCYVVIVTHGHKYDRSVLEKVLSCNCAYVGMIGSKTKIAKVFSQLKEYGIKQSLLGKVHAPIGLNIGAEGPFEIAVSIAAELIYSRKKVGEN